MEEKPSGYPGGFNDTEKTVQKEYTHYGIQKYEKTREEEEKKGTTFSN
jgi:hypothetical protein